MSGPAESGRVAVLGGTGALGLGLVLRLARAGVPTVIGSRDAERAAEAAAGVRSRVPGADVLGAANPDAVGHAERLVALAVPLTSQRPTLTSVADRLSDQHIVLDTTVPLAPSVGGKPTELVGLWAGSAAEHARAALPVGVGLVSGLHTLSAATLADLDVDLAQSTLLCGDRKADKQYVAEVLSRIDGLQVVDAGPLAASRIAEGITAVLIGINIRYRTHAGISITGL